jgi:hypothetical protein
MLSTFLSSLIGLANLYALSSLDRLYPKNLNFRATPNPYVDPRHSCKRKCDFIVVGIKRKINLSCCLWVVRKAPALMNECLAFENWNATTLTAQNPAQCKYCKLHRFQYEYLHYLARTAKTLCSRLILTNASSRLSRHYGISISAINSHSWSFLTVTI